MMGATPAQRDEALRAFEAACEAVTTDVKAAAEKLKLSASKSVRSSLEMARTVRSTTTPVPPEPREDLTGKFAALDPALAGGK